MANPTEITCTADTWVKVADAVQNGTIIVKNTLPSYIITTRDAGSAAPVSITEGRRAFIGCVQEVISASTNRDIYIYSPKIDGLVEVTL